MTFAEFVQQRKRLLVISVGGIALITLVALGVAIVNQGYLRTQAELPPLASPLAPARSPESVVPGRDQEGPSRMGEDDNEEDVLCRRGYGDGLEIGKERTGTVAGARIAAGPAIDYITDGGGGGPPPQGLRPPDPIFSVRGACGANAEGQRLYMTRGLDLINGRRLSAEEVQRVAKKVVDLSASANPHHPEGVIQLPRVSVPEVMRAVHGWPPERIWSYPGQGATMDARELRTDEDAQNFSEQLIAIIHNWGGVGVFLAGRAAGYAVDGERPTEPHMVAIYREPRVDFMVVDEGQVSRLFIERGDRYEWRTTELRGGVRVQVLSSVRQLIDHSFKKVAPPSPTPLPGVP